jgi:hypothetical protein
MRIPIVPSAPQRVERPAIRRWLDQRLSECCRGAGLRIPVGSVGSRPGILRIAHSGPPREPLTTDEFAGCTNTQAIAVALQLEQYVGVFRARKAHPSVGDIARLDAINRYHTISGF